VSAGLRRSFSSLSVPNYRRYFAGQVVSVSGNWMQMVAEGWLVLSLTSSGVAVGIATASQFVPLLFFGALGGLFADRYDKRKLLMCTQAAMAVPALFLLGVTAAGIVTPLMVYATAFTRGAVNALDNPARQSFVIEMVGADRVVNAVSLNSVIIHTSRIVGPALAGVVIAIWGVAPCFGINALSFVAMLVALAGMSSAQLRRPKLVTHERGAFREGLRYVARNRELSIPLLLMAIVGTLSFNFQVVLPLMARFSFGGDATTYAILLSAMAVGSVTGALVNGARGRTNTGLITLSAAAFGVFGLVAAAAPTLPVEILALVPLGMASVTFAASVNSHLQLSVDPLMRGRVMALYSVVFLGSTPIGAPIAGWLSETVGARAGLVLAGVAALAAAVIARVAFSRSAGRVEAPPQLPGPKLRPELRARERDASRAGEVHRQIARERVRLREVGGTHERGASRSVQRGGREVLRVGEPAARQAVEDRAKDEQAASA
jgi:MFS family permease